MTVVMYLFIFQKEKKRKSKKNKIRSRINKKKENQNKLLVSKYTMTIPSFSHTTILYGSAHKKSRKYNFFLLQLLQL